MGRHFGELAKVRGIITYRLSPFEQRAFAGAISKGVPNVIRRIRSTLLISWLIYDQVEKMHHHMLRKDPKEFENDQ
ncbi:hypothetical protein B566_EDAN001759 [Ephemera danica]|nr:hypothetical protein B566_EDAN001759 [Ephemera danica]